MSVLAKVAMTAIAVAVVSFAWAFCLAAAKARDDEYVAPAIGLWGGLVTAIVCGVIWIWQQ